jgi:hypothetical protein
LKLKYGSEGDVYIEKLKNKDMTPMDLVDQELIQMGEDAELRETLNEESTSNNDEIANASSQRANYSRKIEWQVLDVEPVLVHIWVTVNWTDPTKQFKDGEYGLETLLSQ